MQTLTIILIGVAMVVYASNRSPGKTKPSRLPHLKGWQKVFGVLALVVALFIVLNPDFLALGLFGDAAFFDMLVLALTLQMSGMAARVGQACAGLLSRGVRWLGVPNTGLRYALALLTCFLGGTVTAIQKLVHRILS